MAKIQVFFSLDVCSAVVCTAAGEAFVVVMKSLSSQRLTAA